MKRSSFARPQLERKPVVHKPVPEHLRRSATMGPAELKAIPKRATSASKNKTVEEQANMSRVAALGCVVCRRLFSGLFTPDVELHHPRRGAGMGQRASHMDVIPTCYEHHRGNTGIHGLGVKGFEKAYGFNEADLLEDVRAMLAAAN